MDAIKTVLQVAYQVLLYPYKVQSTLGLGTVVVLVPTIVICVY